MKKTIIATISLAIFLAALIAAFFILQTVPEDEPFPEALLPSPRIFELAAPVRSVRIEQAGRDPFILQNLDYSGDISGMLIGRETLPVNSARVTAVLRAAYNLPMVELIEEYPDDLAQYGLVSPRARVTITAADGQVATIIIGDVAPGNIGVYITLEGDSAVYLVPVFALDNYLLPEYDYLSYTITPLPEITLLFDEMIISGGYYSGEIIILPGDIPGRFRLAEPVSHPLSNTAHHTIRGLFGFSSGPIARIYPTEDDLAALGLDDPWAVVEVRSAQLGDFRLRFSAPDSDGMLFVFRDGVPILYTTDIESAPWLFLSWQDFMSDWAHHPHITTLSAVTVETRDLTLLFDIVEVTEIDEPHPEYEMHDYNFDVTVRLNAEYIDGDNFLRFFELITAARLGEQTDEEPASPPILVITYHGATDHTVSFFESVHPRRYLIETGELGGFLVSARYMDELLAGAARIAAGEIVPTFLG